MLILLRVPFVISCLLMAAHLYRYQLIPLAVLCLLFPLLLLLKKRWIPWLLTVIACVYAVEWIRTLTFLIDLYTEYGKPVTRLTIILGTVIAVTLLSALTFRTKTMKQQYNSDV